MFKSLKEKLTGWFKKKEEHVEKEEKPEEEKEGIVKAKKEKKPKKQKEGIQQKTEQAEELQSPQLKEIKLEIAKEKEEQSFLKKLFSRKKEAQEQQLESLKEEIQPQIQIKTEEEIKKETLPPLPEFKTSEEKQEQVQEEKKGFFTKLASKLSTSTLTQEQFDELFKELEITLLENNVALEVVDKIRDELSKDLVGVEIKKSKINETILNSLKETILNLLIEPPNLIQLISKELADPYTIIFVGINGSGKTTTIAKFAHYLKKHNISCVLAAADTFRAASIEQLEKHAERLNIPIIRQQYGADPAAVAFDAKKYAQAHNIRTVLIDTAGRMYTKTNLIKEMEKIVRVSQPDLKIFIGESITGNDAIEQVKTFNESISIDGIILTKADTDEKAGTILSVSYVTKKPIYFLGIGQSYDDLQPFTKKEILKNLGLE